jgi:ATP-binding cassette subfamily F protein 3
MRGTRRTDETEEDSMTLIELRSIEKFYGGRPVLRGLRMKVGPGARIGLIGGNGAGKSTLLRVLAGMEKVERPVLERRKIGLAFRGNVRGGQEVVELRDTGVAFGEDPVLIGVDLTVARGERVGVVGKNGAGKSVLAKVLAGALPPTEGGRWIGPSIKIGYLAQDDEPPRGATPLGLVRDAKPLYEDEAVRLLGRFLFRYEQVREPVGSLSGGERTRLRLLLLMLEEPNCLVLDEPTNHLDIASLEVLEAELERFDGTVVFVSHDRYFLDRIADKIVEVREGELHRYEGGYSAWRERSIAAGDLERPGGALRARSY